MHILNLTQHNPTDEQVAAGVFNFGNQDEMKRILTVKIADPLFGIANVSHACANEHLWQLTGGLFSDFVLPARKEFPEDFAVMVGGFAPLVERVIVRCKQHGIQCLYALTDRVVSEEVQEDGSVKKVAVFKHCGFFPAGVKHWIEYE
jgi:hypothetical protein